MQLILFDIDGTLLMGRGLGREATRRAMLDIFGSSGTLETHQFGGKTDWMTLAEVLAAEGLSAQDIGRHMPVYEDALTRHMTALLAEYPVTALPGALDCVHTVRARANSLTGIVTGNLARTAHVKLRAAGFDPRWFPIAAYGSEALERNALPPLALERARQHSGQAIRPQDVVIIGDTLDDIACARAVGAHVVAVTTGFTARETLAAARPDYLLDHLGDLPALLDQLPLS
jgi:phosphoglycolate phosphatase-like HAD superfamily hydrolase